MIDLNIVLEVFRKAYLIRAIEERIAIEYPSGNIRCPVHLSLGQEFPSSLIGYFQNDLDYAVSTHRAHAHYLAKGGNLRAMIAEIYGKVTGCSLGRGGSMHLSDPSVRFMGSSAIVGNSIPVGLGIAYALKLKKEQGRVFIFIGDGATEEGVFYESVNFALIHKLPTIFVCENNLYSVYTNLSVRQPSNRNILQTAQALGLNSVHIRHNDFTGGFKLLENFLGNSKLEFPKFIEFETYRWLEHCGPENDDKLNYRNWEELSRYRNSDILEITMKELRKIEPEKAQDFIGEIKTEIDAAIEDAFSFANTSLFPSKEIAIGELNQDYSAVRKIND